MHELSIAMNILDRTLEEAERRGGVRVEAVHLWLGPLSGVIKDALLSAYDLARVDSPLASTRLVIEEVPVVVYCEICQAERTIESIQSFCCPACGTPTANVIRGRELEIVALEIEQ
jgi:hydrogenase nickel incorporation protein HypA/HybF